jgi:hypothetical protein
MPIVDCIAIRKKAMIDCVRECRRIYESLRQQIMKLRVDQVAAVSIREAIRNSVDAYFRTDRPILTNYYESNAFSELDIHMQELLSLSQHRSLRSRYVKALRAIVKAFDKLEIHLLPRTVDKVGVQLSAQYEALANSVERVSPAAAKCYRQGVMDLDDSYRTSWRGTATEFREAVREVLDAMATDEDVQASPGYRHEAGAKRPTMRQKARFTLMSRKAKTNSIETVGSLADTVDERFGGFVRNVYSSSSGSVHCHTGKEEIIALKRYVDLALGDLLGISHEGLAA